MQFPKAPSPIESIELGIVIELSPVSLKAVDSIVSKVLGRSMEVRAMQL